MSELLPCPFCGGEARIIRTESGWFLKQEHDDNCWLSDATTVNAAIGEWGERQAIEAWNTRAGAYCAFAQPTDLTNGCALLYELSGGEKC